jgi:hypothetical protein
LFLVFFKGFFKSVVMGVDLVSDKGVALRRKKKKKKKKSAKQSK